MGRARKGWSAPKSAGQVKRRLEAPAVALKKKYPQVPDVLLSEGVLKEVARQTRKDARKKK